MDTVKIWEDRPSDRQAEDIAARLERGEIALMPTDSVYALVCDALNHKAVERLCAIKGLNPDKNTLSVICADISMASEYARLDDAGFRLLKDNVPCAATFIFKAARTLPKAFKGRKEVGVRIPDLATPRMVAEKLGHPIMTTSIEFEDEDYAREPGLIAETYADRADFMIDGGEGGTEMTTVVRVSDAGCEIVREGKVESFN